MVIRSNRIKLILVIVAIELTFLLAATYEALALPTCPAPDPATNFSLAGTGGADLSYLCYKNGTQAPTEIHLSGYSAFNVINLDKFHDASAPNINDYMNTLQYDNATNAHGVNLARTAIFGSNNSSGRVDCETMPFAVLTGGKYDVTTVTTAYKTRLKNTVSNAETAGVAVILDLFSGDSLMGSSAEWPTNPWNPNKSNINDVCADHPLPASGIPFPAFYKICTTEGTPNPCLATNLTCLGQKEKAYVISIVNAVKSAPNAGKNVIFEIMNEATTQNLTSSDIDLYDQWHNTVALWIKNQGGFLTAASVGSESYDDMFSCALNRGGCANFYDIFNQSNIDIVTFHSGMWLGRSICNVATVANARFLRPVIIDDDGSNSQRNNDPTVYNWDNNVFNCENTGQVHFDHIDGPYTWTNFGCSPPKTCSGDNDCMLDCGVIDTEGDVHPTCLRSSCAPSAYNGTLCSFSAAALIVSGTTSPSELQPANGNLIPVSVSLDILDQNNLVPIVTLVSITANQSISIDDIQGAEYGTDDRSFSLRATKNLSTNASIPTARVYTITYQLSDGVGCSSTLDLSIIVP